MKTKPNLNVRLLRKIQKHILEEPKRFWMGWWKEDSIPGHKPAPCGTTACIAGWAVILSNEPEKAGAPSIRARVLLGLDPDDMTLFFSDAWPEPYRTLYERAVDKDDEKDMAKAGADRIEHLINTGE